MKAIITRTNGQRDSVEAITNNDILIVVSCSKIFSLNDEVEFIDFLMDGEVELINRTNGLREIVTIKPDNVHDLRLPNTHGASRIPSPERLRSA